MDNATLTGVIITSALGLIGAMWALLKAMVANRLDRIEAKQDDTQAQVHKLDNRLTALETKHEQATCQYAKARVN